MASLAWVAFFYLCRNLEGSIALLLQHARAQPQQLLCDPLVDWASEPDSAAT
jgi:hypothetical protein